MDNSTASYVPPSYVPPTYLDDSMQFRERRRRGYWASNRERIHPSKGHWIRLTNSKRYWGQDCTGKSIPMRLVTCHPRIWITACKSGGVDEAGIGLAIARAYIRPKGTGSDLPTVKDTGARTAQAKASRCPTHHRPDSIPVPGVRHPVTQHTERNARSAKWH
jgi:hypothetical protein